MDAQLTPCPAVEEAKRSSGTERSNDDPFRQTTDGPEARSPTKRQVGTPALTGAHGAVDALPVPEHAWHRPPPVAGRQEERAPGSGKRPFASTRTVHAWPGRGRS
jgi:hypothetical protein